MEAFNASDQDGAWTWKDAYEASEAAAVLFLRKYAAAMLKKAGSAARYLAMLERLAALLPSHTRRSEESEQFQQFSTPLGLGYLVRLAAQITPRRPSARTLGRHRAFGHPCRDSRRKPPSQRARRNQARPAFRPVSKGAPKPLQRRADRRLPGSPSDPFGRGDEPALFGLAQYLAHHARRHRAAYPLRPAAACAGRPPCGAYAPLPQSRQSRNQGALCRFSGRLILCFHREARRPHLRASWHQRRNPAYGHRPG